MTHACRLGAASRSRGARSVAGIAAALLAGLAASGCYPDFSGYSVQPAPLPDGQVRRRDAGPRDDGGERCAPPVTCPGECALPWLLASVEDLDGECGGQVWRFSLTGTRDAWCTCAPLTGRGSMPALPFSVGFAPPETVVIAAEDDRVMAVDGRTDRVLWEEPYQDQPVDVFAIESDTGLPMIAVAGRPRTRRDITHVRFYDAALGGAPIERTLNGDLPLGLGVVSMSQSSFDRGWLRALKGGSAAHAAADVDPWTNQRVEPPHTADREGFVLRTLHSSYDGTFHRTVWTGSNSDRSGVYRLARSMDVGDNRVPLPERCDERPDGSDYDVSCEYVHAVADPQLNTASFALCQYAGFERRIVRLGLIGDCRDLADSGALAPRLRISRLALGQISFWP